jgi:hypothetical protein
MSFLIRYESLLHVQGCGPRFERYGPQAQGLGTRASAVKEYIYSFSMAVFPAVCGAVLSLIFLTHNVFSISPLLKLLLEINSTAFPGSVIRENERVRFGDLTAVLDLGMSLKRALP